MIWPRLDILGVELHTRAIDFFFLFIKNIIPTICSSPKEKLDWYAKMKAKIIHHIYQIAPMTAMRATVPPTAPPIIAPL